MSALIDRRNWPRNIPEQQLLSILQAKGLACNIETCAKDILYMFVDVKNCSDGGFQLQIPFQLAAGTTFNLSVADRNAGSWTTRSARIVWTRLNPDGLYSSGVEFLQADMDPDLAGQWETDPLKPSPADLLFLINASFFQAISEQGLCLLLNALRKTVVKSGERIITQGESGKCLYLIQDGVCTVFVEKHGQSHVVVRLKAGDVLGEMAVLTGEPRTASVDAETDMVLWKLDLKDFEDLACSHPELRLFLTEIMSKRFDSSLFVGDRTIGKYVLSSKIGTGAWGIVYRGLHKVLKLPVAIKMMKHDMAMEPSFLNTFRQEAEIIARMSHPSIVSVYDIEEIYKTIFIIMEYLEGNSLKEHMKKVGPLPVKRCVEILLQVCDGLACAHALDIIHRDIKPANIFLLENDQVKLLDFGLACAPGTEDMNIRGTVHYAPPEQIDGWPVDARSDIYSMGVMAYEMVTGTKPYPGKNLAEVMELHCSRDLPDPAGLVPGLPQAFRDFVMTCGRCAPDDRFQHASEARAMLSSLGSGRRKSRTTRKNKERTVTSLLLIHPPEKQQALKLLLEDFGRKASELGINLQVSEFKDV
jgi:eukaryotic-like serine/threonine-protein kinase